jgi:hypothetical protein
VTRTRAGVLLSGLVGLVVLAAGCAVGTDDELAPAPTTTVTATPSQSLAPAPATIPVGTGDVSPTDVVWAQGSVLHVGKRRVDLATVEVEAFVVVRGGVFVLSGGELWFTDLERLRGTAQTDLTKVRISGDADRLAVTDTRSGSPLEQGYDTRTGKAIRGTVETLTPQQVRAGPGKYEVRTREDGPSVVDTSTGREVKVSGLPATFELGAWSGDSTFYGVADTSGKLSIVSCDLVRHRCTPQGSVPGSGQVVFGTGQ